MSVNVSTFGITRKSAEQTKTKENATSKGKLQKAQNLTYVSCQTLLSQIAAQIVIDK